MSWHHIFFVMWSKEYFKISWGWNLIYLVWMMQNSKLRQVFNRCYAYLSLQAWNVLSSMEPLPDPFNNNNIWGVMITKLDRYIDIGGIDDRHWLNFLFIIYKKNRYCCACIPFRHLILDLITWIIMVISTGVKMQTELCMEYICFQ